ncbi:protease SohB [Teredinibacter waterburyi]|uniref:protease SohB n=1 Tax=Teredinibacter waterburyi TaxID=1500538 RepID=UPI00165F7B93|nr:protease SohB [Teredinibacter waterburyi]
MEFLSEYGLFLAKTVTFVIAIAVVVAIVVAAGMKNQTHEKGHLEVRKLNEKYKHIREGIQAVVVDEKTLKAEQKQQKKDDKLAAKQAKVAAKKAKSNADKSDVDVPGDSDSSDTRSRIFVIDFDGDIKASATEGLRQVITGILSLAQKTDRVVVRLESQGGMVHSYGLASSQLARITEKGIPLTVCIDKVAASGGYMMACVANQIVAAPFAIIGSIGVVAQLPNFHKLLQKNDIDYELLTAGEYKRTLTMFGENTEKGRSKFVEDLEDTHELFKSFITEHRGQVDIDAVATGEIWFGSRALAQKLVDDIQTSDQYLLDRCEEADVFEVEYVQKKSLQEKLGIGVEHAAENILTNLLHKMNFRFFS